jgi:hypothetical protein
MQASARFRPRLTCAHIAGDAEHNEQHGCGEPSGTEFENTFDLDREPAFRDYRELVNAYVIRRRAKLPTEACVIGLIGPDRLKHAWVVWSKGREIILLEGGDTDLRISRRRLRIPADVVNRETELKGSTIPDSAVRPSVRD